MSQEPKEVEVRPQQPERFTGTCRAFLLYDVAEEIDLRRARHLLGVDEVTKAPTFKHPAPDYVAFERPPVVEPLEPFVLSSGERRSAPCPGPLGRVRLGVRSGEGDMVVRRIGIERRAR